MREHQIVISLKREHFEEVQRLARLSGSNSPSAYLRDRILAMLGIEQAEKDEEATGSRPVSANITQVRQDLARMHHELQFFIAESLSSGRYLLEGEGTASFEEPYLAYGQVERSLDADLSSFSQSSERAFKMQEEGGKEAAGSGKLWSVYDEPTSQLGIFDDSNGGTSGVFLTHHQGSPQQRIGTPADISQILDSFERIDDELEGLAERAFVISPRLGPTEESGVASESARPMAPPPIIPREPARVVVTAEELFPEAVETPPTPAVPDAPPAAPIVAPDIPEELDPLSDLLDDMLVQRMSAPVSFDNFWDSAPGAVDESEKEEPPQEIEVPPQEEVIQQEDEVVAISETNDAPKQEQMVQIFLEDDRKPAAWLNDLVQATQKTSLYDEIVDEVTDASESFSDVYPDPENDPSADDEDSSISGSHPASLETTNRSDTSGRFPPPKRGGAKKSNEDLSGGPPPKRRRT